MNDKPPCLIIRQGAVYSAYNEDGRRIAGGGFNSLSEILWLDGYEIVSHNSRIGRTIIDKLQEKGIKV